MIRENLNICDFQIGFSDVNAELFIWDNEMFILEC